MKTVPIVKVWGIESWHLCRTAIAHRKQQHWSSQCAGPHTDYKIVSYGTTMANSKQVITSLLT